MCIRDRTHFQTHAVSRCMSEAASAVVRVDERDTDILDRVRERRRGKTMTEIVVVIVAVIVDLFLPRRSRYRSLSAFPTQT